MAAECDVIVEFNKMVQEHISNLWIVVGGLLGIETLIIAHLVKLRQLRLRRWVLATFLIISITSGVVSLGAGYLSESAIVASMQDYAASKVWAPSIVAENCVLVQMIAMVLGMILFALAFPFYATVLASIIVRAGGLPIGGGGEHGGD